MRLTLLALVFLSVLRPLSAAPRQVILIRHAEKPSDGVHLSEKGKRRAQALVGFFLHDPRVTEYGTPRAIYATHQKDDDGSARPIETVRPLSKALSIEINEEFKKSHVDELVGEVMNEPRYEGHTVLISWKHSYIPELAKDFGASHVPSDWEDDVFDRAWILDFTGNHVTRFRDIPQRVLPGDSQE